jgi:hypothetical protein
MSRVSPIWSESTYWDTLPPSGKRSRGGLYVFPGRYTWCLRFRVQGLEFSRVEWLVTLVRDEAHPFPRSSSGVKQMLHRRG